MTPMERHAKESTYAEQQAENAIENPKKSSKTDWGFYGILNINLKASF
jgi:hypothetical protein